MERLFCDPRRCVGCRACEIACAVEHTPSKDLFVSVLNRELGPDLGRVLPLIVETREHFVEREFQELVQTVGV